MLTSLPVSLQPGSKPGSVVLVAGMGIVGERAAWHDCKRGQKVPAIIVPLAVARPLCRRWLPRYIVQHDLGRPQSTGLAAQVLDLVVPIGR